MEFLATNMNGSQEVLNTTEDTANVSNFTESVNNISTKPSSYAPYEYYVTISDNFHFYAISIIMPCGLIGNFFSICVFLLSSILRRTTTGQYLVALAIADSTVLLGEVLRWLSYHTAIQPQYYLHPSLGLNIFDTSNAVCKMTYFLRYGGALWSVWLTVAIAVERMIRVAFPLKTDRISTLRTGKIVIFIIAFISFSLAVFSFWHFKIQFDGDTPQCKIWKNDGYQIWNTVTLKFGTLVFPGVLIAIATVIIIVLLHRARNQRMSQLPVSEQGPRKGNSHLRLSTESQLTIMLLAVCISTTALRAPYTIAYYFRTECWKGSQCNSLMNVQTYVAYRVAEVFNIVNYAINFVLYCLSSSSFREQIKKKLCQGSKDGNACDTQQMNLEALSVPQLESKSPLLKHGSKASASVDASDI